MLIFSLALLMDLKIKSSPSCPQRREARLSEREKVEKEGWLMATEKHRRAVVFSSHHLVCLFSY